MTDPRPRTAAATDASVEKRRRAHAERLAVEEFAPRVRLLSDETLQKLTRLLLVHCDARELDVTELLREVGYAKEPAHPEG